MGATFLMFDAVTPANIPGRAWAVAGYSNGLYQWKESDWQRLSNSWRLSITISNVHNGARICDCETEDLTDQEAADWCLGELWSLRRPTVYCNKSTHPGVVSTLAGHGLAFGPDVWLWLADPDGVNLLDPAMWPGQVAKQYAQGPGAAYDLSVVDPLWVQTIASGGPPGAQVPAPNAIATVKAPTGTFTTGLAELNGGLGLDPSTPVMVTQNGTTFTTDIGSLLDSGLI